MKRCSTVDSTRSWFVLAQLLAPRVPVSDERRNVRGALRVIPAERLAYPPAAYRDTLSTTSAMIRIQVAISGTMGYFLPAVRGSRRSQVLPKHGIARGI